MAGPEGLKPKQGPSDSFISWAEGLLREMGAKDRVATKEIGLPQKAEAFGASELYRHRRPVEDWRNLPRSRWIR